MADNVTTPPATDYSGVREYVGARYVPVFANPAEWDNTRGYEPLTVVLYQGNSYTSTQYVPTGIDIKNTQFWLNTGNYNAQVEAYRKEVLAFDGRITDNTNSITGINTELVNINTTIDTIEGEISSLEGDIAAEESARKAADIALGTRIDQINTRLDADKYMVVIGDSFSAGSQTGTPFWHHYVGLQLGLQVQNQAVSGAGFIVGTTFQTQVNTLPSNLTSDNVEVVYVFGGLNDLRASNFNGSAFQNALTAFAETLNNRLPNVRVVVYGPNSFPTLHENHKTAALYMGHIFSRTGWEYHNVMFEWNWLNDFFGANDHPSSSGSARIASTFLGKGSTAPIVFIPENQAKPLPKATIASTDGATTITPTGVNYSKGSGNDWYMNFQVNKGSSLTSKTQWRLNIPGNPFFYPVSLYGNYFIDAKLVQGNTIAPMWATDSPGYLRFQTYSSQFTDDIVYGSVHFGY
jgi:hypothetical protein